MENNNDFKELDLKIFAKCAEEMKYDDFIYSDLFNVKNSTYGYEIGGPRLDAHLMAEGHFTVEDIQKTTEILDENLTIDQIIGICGKFVDLQCSRLNGHCVLTNILTSIYIQKDYEVKHPILKLLFRLFSHVSLKIEKFTFDLRYIASFWSYNKNYEKFFTSEDETKLKEEFSKVTLPPPLQGLVNFEFDLSHFLDGPVNNTLNTEIQVPTETNEIGIDKFIHFRDASPTNPPPKQQIPTHEESIALLHQLVKEVNEIPSLFPGEMNLLSLIRALAKWNELGDHVALSRFVLINRIITDSSDLVFHKVDIKQYIKNELKPYYIHPKFFSHPGFSTFSEAFKTVFVSFVQKLCAPIPTAHSFLSDEGAKYWQYIQSQGFEHFQTSVKDSDIPKCVSEDHRRAASMVFPFWSTQIASELLLLTHRWGFKNQVYLPRELHISLYCTNAAAKISTLSYSQSRIAFAVYRVKDSSKKNSLWHRKAEAVNKLIPEKSSDEVYCLMISELSSGCFKIIRMLKKWNSIQNLNDGIYYREKEVYNNRMLSYTKMLHFPNQPYEDFEREMSLDIFGDHTKLIIEDAVNTFKSAKTYSAQYMKMTNDNNPEIKTLLKCIVINSLFLAKLTPESKVKISFENHFMYPTFSFIQ